MEILKNRKGFTIIESLVAIAILSILLLGILASIIVIMDYTTRNLLREEAVKIAEEYADKYRSYPVSLLPNSKEITVKRKIRNFDVDYTVKIKSTSVNPQLKQLTITVEWQYKGKTYTYKIETLVG